MTPADLSRRPSRRLNLWLVALALGLLTGCQEEGLWLSIDPTQCLTNPWDQAWLLTHDYADYPRTQSGQLAIFRDYYTGQGLVIHDVRAEQVFDEVCGACSCPTGQRYFILVGKADERAFLDLGFEREDG